MSSRAEGDWREREEKKKEEGRRSVLSPVYTYHSFIHLNIRDLQKTEKSIEDLPH